MAARPGLAFARVRRAGVGGFFALIGQGWKFAKVAHQGGFFDHGFCRIFRVKGSGCGIFFDRNQRFGIIEIARGTPFGLARILPKTVRPLRDPLFPGIKFLLVHHSSLCICTAGKNVQSRPMVPVQVRHANRPAPCAASTRHPPAMAQFLMKMVICHGSLGI